MNQHTIQTKAEMLIRKPVAEVFEAFINPEITSKFWFTRGSGRLEAGKQVQWDWEMYDISIPVTVQAIEPNKNLVVLSSPLFAIDFAPAPPATLHDLPTPSRTRRRLVGRRSLLYQGVWTARAGCWFGGASSWPLLAHRLDRTDAAWSRLHRSAARACAPLHSAPLSAAYLPRASVHRTV